MPSLKNRVSILDWLILLLLCVLLPPVLFAGGLIALKSLFIFYAAASAVAAFIFSRFRNRKNITQLSASGLQEKINLTQESLAQARKNYSELQEKILRYSKLKVIVEELNKSLFLEQICGHLCDIAFGLISQGKGACLLYLIDRNSNTLSLYKTKKEDPATVIKAKQGDIFDLWVTRHVAPLLVEDAKKDFRFDAQRLSFYDQRPINSLIAVPLINEHRFQGILRLDSPQPDYFSQDDLRILVTLCDFGAVAIENSELFQKTQDLAIHDGLTGVYTKGYFAELLQEECKRSLRRSTPVSLLMLDIDFFKRYNDTFGHTAGDIVLKNLCQTMQESLKEMAPLIGRFGGEEFCALLPGADKQKAYEAAQQLRAAVERQNITLRRQATKYTVSIGLANFPQDTISPDELFMKADQALYKAKNQGRNKAVSA